MDGWYALVAAGISGLGALGFLRFVADALAQASQGLKQLELAQRRAQARRQAEALEPVTVSRET